MQVGVLKEIKAEENRVSLTPHGAEALIQAGHQVLVETSAGEGSGFTDADYLDAGADIAAAADIFACASLLLHVKEPQPSEYPLLRPDQVIFTYFHFAASRSLLEAMLASRTVCIAYETVTDAQGGLPLLTPMSEVAGRMAAQEGAKYLERALGGRGILLGGVTGVAPATVVVLGGGVVGTNAAQMACGLGAKVYLLDTSLQRLQQLANEMPKNCFPVLSTPAAVRELVRDADLVIGAVLVRGARAPKLVTREMVRGMKKGAVLVDVAIDQGGCFETSQPTTHADPVYLVDGVVHYCVSNMPGAVPLTSTLALTNATLPYILKLANHGWREAARRDAGLRSGVSLVDGKLVSPPVAAAFGHNCFDIGILLATSD